MNVKVLKNVQERICESGMLYGIEVRGGLKVDCKITGEIHRRLWKKVIRIARITASDGADWEIGRKSRKSVKFYSLRLCQCRISLMEQD